MMLSSPTRASSEREDVRISLLLPNRTLLAKMLPVWVCTLPAPSPVCGTIGTRTSLPYFIQSNQLLDLKVEIVGEYGIVLVKKSTVQL